MRKHILTRTTALLAALLIAVCGFTSNAQRGEKVLGVAGGYATFNRSGMVDVYFQYSFAEHVRIAPEIGYIVQNNGKAGFEASIDMHFPFRVAKAFKLYPLAGVTFNNWSYSSDKSSDSRGGFDFGGGFDLYFTQNLKLSVQGKYSLMNDTGGGFFTVGLGYVF
ncbi:MAG: outer membrane beta-barrel protein [Muribaculaceae bacterium]|nr:outer membrane beta-barrel protein [Muribaculaceae bacterium]